MALDVTVLRVFTDEGGRFGNQAGVVWIDQQRGLVRSRSFASKLGIADDEATGAAAVAITARLQRDLVITQGKGSELRTSWDADGWVRVGGRVLDDGIRRLA